MRPSSPGPTLLLCAVAVVLALLVGLVSSGEREITLPRANDWIEPSRPARRASEVELAPVPALEDTTHSAPPALEPAPVGTAQVEPARLTGLVLRLDGEPAASARILLGQQSARCALDGRFELELPSRMGAADLVAFEPGFEPALRPAFGASLSPRGVSHVRLVLGPETLILSGTVVDPGGLPQKGWTVELDGLDVLADLGLREGVRTDGDGLFVLADVPAGVHVVRAWKERRELAFRSAPISAGEQGLTIVAE